MPRLKRMVPALLALALGLAACGGDDGGEGVGVTLSEFAIAVDSGSTSAGEVTFNIENGGAETHEFVVIQTDLAPAELPTVEDGSVSEEGEGMTVEDEVEDLPSGDTAELTVDLDAGSYVLICNIVEEEDDGTFESHYQEGMRTAFTVE
jgi:uncharacterized cupredoxin-like copper-binding protein